MNAEIISALGPSAAAVLIASMFIGLEYARMKILARQIQENTRALGEVSQVLTKILEGSPKVADKFVGILGRLDERLTCLENERHS